MRPSAKDTCIRAHDALVVYDISKQESFIRSQLWLRELEKHCIPGSIGMVLLGNKGDLSELRQVTLQEGHSLAIDRGLLFMETLAKSGNQVSELMLAIGADWSPLLMCENLLRQLRHGKLSSQLGRKNLTDRLRQGSLAIRLRHENMTSWWMQGSLVIQLRHEIPTSWLRHVSLTSRLKQGSLEIWSA
eukprot:XP_014028415.1 PREDICTED: ras-related protein Rab-31-like [Salmo salar]